MDSYAFNWLTRSFLRKRSLKYNLSIIAIAVGCAFFASLDGGIGPNSVNADASPRSHTPNTDVEDPPGSAAVAAPDYAVNHVIFNHVGLRLYTTGEWAPYVNAQDSFMLVSGNNKGAINPGQVNSWARTLRARYPEVTIYAATSGLKNVRDGAPKLDTRLVSGLILIYEPKQDNAPEFSWSQRRTEANWRAAAEAARRHGLEAWGKPSGRAAAGRDKHGRWNYGRLARIVDGQNIQTQGSCRDIRGNGDYGSGLRQALGSVIQQIRNSGADSQVFAQVTTSAARANRNAVTPQQAFQCAQAAWDYPEVKRVTLWNAVGDAKSVSAAAKFLALRDAALKADSRAIH